MKQTKIISYKTNNFKLIVQKYIKKGVRDKINKKRNERSF